MIGPPPPGSAWYHHPWAWLVFGLPALTVVACLATIWIAVTSSDGLVVDDYYKQGLEINRRLDREARASALGLTLGAVQVHGSDYALTLEADHPDSVFPTELTVGFAHATRAAGDHRTRAEHLGGGRYRGTFRALDGGAAPRLAQGPWYIEVVSAEWRLVKRITVDARGSSGTP